METGHGVVTVGLRQVHRLNTVLLWGGNLMQHPWAGEGCGRGQRDDSPSKAVAEPEFSPRNPTWPVAQVPFSLRLHLKQTWGVALHPLL